MLDLHNNWDKTTIEQESRPYQMAGSEKNFLVFLWKQKPVIGGLSKYISSIKIRRLPSIQPW